MLNSFGDRLRGLLQQQRLSQQDLADALDIPRNTVWRWVNGKATPESNNLHALATFLHVSVEDLLNESPPDNSGDWILSITVRQKLEDEVIDLAKPIPQISTIVTARDGAYIALGGNYALWADDEGFKAIIAELKKMRKGVLQQGKASGGIPNK